MLHAFAEIVNARRVGLVRVVIVRQQLNPACRQTVIRFVRGMANVIADRVPAIVHFPVSSVSRKETPRTTCCVNTMNRMLAV